MKTEEGGFYWDDYRPYQDARRPVRVKYRAEVPGDYAGTFISDSEMLSGKALVSVSPNGEKLVELAHQWGAQDAAAFARYSESGEFIEFILGEGDQTPYPLVGPAGEWSFSTPVWDRIRGQQEDEDRWHRQADAGEALDGGAVISHLRSSYRLGQNPLPTLRRRHGGVWKWADTWCAGNAGDVVFVSHSGRRYPDSGAVWQVTWTPPAE